MPAAIAGGAPAWLRRFPNTTGAYCTCRRGISAGAFRGNPLSWAVSERAELERDYDLVVATSMVDLATLKGLVPSLANTPSVVYFHENQFAYPLSAEQHNSIEPQMGDALRCVVGGTNRVQQRLQPADILRGRRGNARALSGRSAIGRQHIVT